MFWDFEYQPITLRIQTVGVFEECILYELRIDYLQNISDQYNQIDPARVNLGFFYVTDDIIYRMEASAVTVSYLSYGNREEINNFISGSQIVCQEAAMPDALGKDNKGWHESIEADGNKRHFQSYNDLVESGWYEEFIWEKDIGLIYYKSGFGTGRWSIEFGQ